MRWTRHVMLLVVVAVLEGVRGGTVAVGGEVREVRGGRRVEVEWVTDGRLPGLSEGQRKYVLERAAEMIEASSGVAVEFGGGGERTAGEVVKQVRERAAPLSVVGREVPDLAGVTEEGMLPWARRALNAQGAAAKFKVVLGRAGGGEGDGAAGGMGEAVAKSYVERVRRMAGMKGLDGGGGEALVSGEVGAAYRLSFWAWLQAFGEGKGDSIRLVLFNGFVVEDCPGDSSAHTFVFGTAFGLTNFGTGESMVAYQLLLNPDAAVSPRVVVGAAGEKERLDSIAYVVAHEVAGHQILLGFDRFDSAGGILRPVVLVDEAVGGKPVESTTRPVMKLNPEWMRMEAASRRLAVAMKRNDGEETAAEMKRIEENVKTDEAIEWILSRAAELSGG